MKELEKKYLFDFVESNEGKNICIAIDGREETFDTSIESDHLQLIMFLSLPITEIKIV